MSELTARRRASVAVALVVSLALVSAELATFAHDLMTTHVYCPEHGSVVDVSLADAAPSSQGAEAASLAAAADPGEEHGHEHCLATLFVRVADAGAPAAPAALRPPLQSMCLPVLVSDHPAAIPLLRLAPKSSPPRAGRA